VLPVDGLLGDWSTRMRRLICLFSIFVAGPAFGATSLLECSVHGQQTDVGGDEKKALDPATVQVKIEYEPAYLSVEVSGPGDYAVAESSAARDGKVVAKAIASDDSFILQTTVQLPAGDSETAILIDRQNAAIDVMRDTSTAQAVSETSYSGPCTDRTTGKF
jgi:hypothetical protein